MKKITMEGFFSNLYDKWKNKKLKGVAKTLLDKNPELRKSFQNINKATDKAMEDLYKMYPELRD
jgi:hypothetical protein|tara:strand:- start:3231 stop:3422 length:192 start_codon:yes stop_codon:yes gene_type:complete